MEYPIHAMTEAEASALPSLTLAYIGDGIYEIGIRRFLISKGIRKVDELHKTAVDYVKASFQSGFYYHLTNLLTEEELAVMKRGRNTKTGHKPKSSDAAEYHNATGVEALFGYIWLSNQTDRLNELFSVLYQYIEDEQCNE